MKKDNRPKFSKLSAKLNPSKKDQFGKLKTDDFQPELNENEWQDPISTNASWKQKWQEDVYDNDDERRPVSEQQPTKERTPRKRILVTKPQPQQNYNRSNENYPSRRYSQDDGYTNDRPQSYQRDNDSSNHYAPRQQRPYYRDQQDNNRNQDRPRNWDDNRYNSNRDAQQPDRRSYSRPYEQRNQQQPPRYESRDNNNRYSQREDYNNNSQGDNYKRPSFQPRYNNRNYDQGSYSPNNRQQYPARERNDNYRNSNYNNNYSSSNNYSNSRQNDYERRPQRQYNATPPAYDNRSFEEMFAEGMRLNKYLAHSGIASRRKADEYIEQGAVTVNDIVVREMGFKVKKGDIILFNGKPVKPEQKTYILLNKPKNVITTTNDEKGRQTVLDIVANATNERIYPVGRLDRGTTGLLLLTNDGELAQKLAHPSKMVQKIYHVTLDQPLSKRDLEHILEGVMLEDGLVPVDDAHYVGINRDEVGIEIHVGRNRVVRRLFEHLGYKVVKLDRVVYAGLTKKSLGRGEWRYLEPREVGFLQYYQPRPRAKVTANTLNTEDDI